MSVKKKFSPFGFSVWPARGNIYIDTEIVLGLLINFDKIKHIIINVSSGVQIII